MADPADVSVVIPAFNEGAVDRRGRRGARGRRPVARDHRRRRRVERRHRRARRGGRRDGRPPSLQQGQRRRGQDRHPARDRRVRAHHRRRRPAQRRGRAAAGRAARRVRSRHRRALGRDAGDARAARSATPRSTGSRATSPDATFRISRRASARARREYLREFLHLLPNGFSTPTTTTLAFIKAGYNVAFEPIEARQRVGQSKIRFARDGAKFFMIILKIVTLFSPLRVFLPISLRAFALGAAYAVVDRSRRRAMSPTRRSC